MIYGTNNSADGPHIQTFTNTDNYPLLQIASLAHNDMFIGFDCYHDATTYRSSNSGSNFVLGKICKFISSISWFRYRARNCAIYDSC